MPQDFTVQPANLSEAFLRGRSQVKGLRQQEAQTQLAEKKLTAFDEDRTAAKQAASAAQQKEEQDDLLRLFGADAMQITESYGEGSKAALSAAQSKVKQYTDMYAETGDERYLQAADNLQAAVKGGVDRVIQMSGGVANMYMRRLGEDPEFLKPKGAAEPQSIQEAKFAYPDDPEAQRDYVARRARGGSRTAAEEAEISRSKAREAEIGKAEGEAAAAKVVGSDAYNREKQAELDAATSEEELRASAVNTIRESRRNIAQVRDLKNRAGPDTTGFAQAAWGWVPWTEAGALRKNITSLQAKIGFKTLQDMRDKSKTGGALGQVSERELELLYSSIASIDPTLSEEELKKSFDEVLHRWERSTALLEAEYEPDSPWAGMTEKEITAELNRKYPPADQKVDVGSLTDEELFK